VQLSAPITRAQVQANPATGVVTTTLASAAGAVPGVSNLAIANATNASPIAVTTTSAHGLSSGNFVTISGALGHPKANRNRNTTVTGASSFTLNGRAGNAAYIAGGIVEGGDLGEVDTVIQANCVPSGETAITQSATAFNVTIVGSVVVPLAQVAAYQAAAQL